MYLSSIKLVFKHESHLKVDMGDLQGEKEALSSFMHSQFNLNSSSSHEGLELNAEQVSPQELERIVNKFVYHKNLNNAYWATLEKNVVKINKFKRHKKIKENKHPLTPSIIKHGW